MNYSNANNLIEKKIKINVIVNIKDIHSTSLLIIKSSLVIVV